MKHKSTGTGYTKEKIETFISMHKKGCMLKDIRATLGLSSSQAKYLQREYLNGEKLRDGFTAEQIDKFRELYTKRYTYKNIAKEMELTHNQIVSMKKTYVKGSIRPFAYADQAAYNQDGILRSRVTAEQIERFRELYTRRYTYKEIANEMGLTLNQVIHLKTRYIQGTRRRNDFQSVSDQDFLYHLVNAFGSPHFSAEEVIEALHETINQLQEKNKNTGSLLALINILPEIEEECKSRY